jgi:ATP-binding cassette subfamily B protein
MRWEWRRDVRRNMNPTVADLSWPAARLVEAIDALGRHSGLTARTARRHEPCGPPAQLDDTALGRWIEASAGWLGFEAEAVETPYPDVESFVRTAGPALLRLPGEGGARFLVLLGGDRKRVFTLSPGGTRVCLDPRPVRDALCRGVEAARLPETERLLDGAQIRGRRRQRAREGLLGQLMAHTRLGGCWLVRAAGTAGLSPQIRAASLPAWLGVLLGAHLGASTLWLTSWWLLGWMSLQGRLEPGWLLAWAMLLLTQLPLRLFSTYAGGVLSIRGGAILKRRLLAGALCLDPNAVRRQGVGQLLGRVIEADVVETMALSGGFLGLTAILELVLAAGVFGAASGLHLVLLVGTAMVTGVLAWRYLGRRRSWTDQRLDLTDELVERMVGHRTRLAQQRRADWNAGEDRALEGYLESSRRLDGLAIALQVVVPRGWFLSALLGLAPAFMAGSHRAAVLAVGVGGIVLAYRALRNLGEGLERLAAAAIAWQRVAPLWQAAAQHEAIGSPALAFGAARAAEGQPLLEACDLVYRYHDAGAPALQGLSLRIHAGDRLLLQGPSGGGKSTLATLLAGAQTPASGLLLLRGLDRAVLGTDRWTRRVVLAPQFHDNHVLLGTFAFNALLGRNWPPNQADLDEAERVCRALSLGPLLERMPAGMQQMIGETGWQLSHGEKSRLYIARALLQGAELVLLDESFAALDPATLQRTLSYVLDQAPTVVVIAHP